MVSETCYECISVKLVSDGLEEELIKFWVKVSVTSAGQREMMVTYMIVRNACILMTDAER